MTLRLVQLWTIGEEPRARIAVAVTSEVGDFL